MTELGLGKFYLNEDEVKFSYVGEFDPDDSESQTVVDTRFQLEKFQRAILELIRVGECVIGSLSISKQDNGKFYIHYRFIGSGFTWHDQKLDVEGMITKLFGIDKSEHQCCMQKKYCISDLSSKIIMLAKGLLPELLMLEEEGQLKTNLETAFLVCKKCNHKGMFSNSIHGEAPGNPGYMCNYEEDFVICPRCGHWAVVENPFVLEKGTKV